ncbi:hypothetical protein ACT6QH_09725 [Xanthobacter sp. TB0139]|uniref:hypothetical protein n=1 Tax=Xanthobacter sp. TB0139 TaxID=3459178 RepID=UPI00403A36E7
MEKLYQRESSSPAFCSIEWIVAQNKLKRCHVHILAAERKRRGSFDPRLFISGER